MHRSATRDPVARRARLRSRLVVGGVLAVAGMLFTVTAGAAAGTDLRAETSDLVGLLRDETGRVDRAGQRVSALRDEVSALTADVDDAEVQALRSQSTELAPAAGLAPLRGPGVRVVLDDAPRDLPAPEWAGPDDLVVHQQDVQAVINALWAGGAEGLMIMDQRVIGTSAVRCVGSTLRLQGRVYSPPYVITAIGDPHQLQDSLARDGDVGTYRSWSDLVGLGYGVDQLDDTRVPGFEGTLELQYAQVPAPAAREVDT